MTGGAAPPAGDRRPRAISPSAVLPYGAIGPLSRTVGFGCSAYLAYRELFTINAVCPWCIVNALPMTLLAASPPCGSSVPNRSRLWGNRNSERAGVGPDLRVACLSSSSYFTNDVRAVHGYRRSRRGWGKRAAVLAGGKELRVVDNGAPEGAHPRARRERRPRLGDTVGLRHLAHPGRGHPG